MGQKFRNSWQLVKASAAVLKSDKELVVFPIVSFLAVALVTLSFAIPLFISGDIQNSESIYGLLNILFLFLYYLIIYTIIIFSNTAIVGAALKRMKGENPTLRDGITVALGRMGTIVGYALISATIGILLRLVQERLGFFGKLFSFLANLSWNIVTYLVIPTLVVENIGPIKAIKRSSQLLRKTWGEQLIGNFGIGFIFGFIIIGLFILFFPLAIITTNANMLGLTLALGIIFVLVILMLFVISSTLNMIYIAALYRFASEGIAAGPFEERILRNSFRQK